MTIVTDRLLKRLVNRLASCLALVSIVFNLPGCGSADDQEQLKPGPHVEAMTLQQQNHFTITREFIGRVTPTQTAAVGFELSGTINKLLFHEGDRVSLGQPIAELDMQLLKAEREELDARVRQIESDMDLAKTNKKRLESLKESGFTSSLSIDEINSRVTSLKAQRSQLDASILANQTRLEKSVLHAPFDATISAREVAIGEVVQPGKAVYNLLQVGTLEARIGVPKRLLQTLGEKQTVSIRVENQIYIASLLAINSQVERRSRTVQIRYSLPAHANLFDGQLAYLQLQESIPQAGFWVPLDALSEGLRGRWVVMAVVPDEQRYLTEVRDVVVHYATSTEAFVSGALEDGETIVSRGVHKLAPKQAVSPVAASVSMAGEG